MAENYAYKPLVLYDLNGDERAVLVDYQLFVRLFGNTNGTRKFNGTIDENGCGKFADVNDAALSSLKGMGFTHIWLTGVLEQASGTAYPGRPADHPEILIISNIKENGQPIGLGDAGHFWHSDLSYKEKPRIVSNAATVAVVTSWPMRA